MYFRWEGDDDNNDNNKEWEQRTVRLPILNEFANERMDGWIEFNSIQSDNNSNNHDYKNVDKTRIDERNRKRF